MIISKYFKGWRVYDSAGLEATPATIPANQAQIQTHLITTSSQTLTLGVVTAITNLTATITPSSTAKRIKVTVRWNGESSDSATDHNITFGLTRDGTVIGSPAAAGARNVGLSAVSESFGGSDADSTPASAFYDYIDSPATTSAVVYNATARANSTRTLFNQRTVGDVDSINFERLTSTMILEEIN